MDNQKKAAIITKALAYTENGGKPSKAVAGKSGEMKSIFQFTPGTWKKYAKEIAGQEDLPLNNENEAAVVHQKISKWLDQGKSVEQIASMWNAGEKRPDAYKQNWRGVNKYGVAYDTPAYAKKVVNYVSKFEKEPDVPELGQQQAPQEDPKQKELSNKLDQLKQIADTNRAKYESQKVAGISSGLINRS